MSDTNYARIVEAVLFTAEEPMSLKEIESHLPDGAVETGQADVKTIVQQLADDYGARGFNLVCVGGGKSGQTDKLYEFRTATDMTPFLTTVKTVTRKISRAAVETLAIVAYHQPVTRGEIEEIRGVAISKGVLDTLLEQKWIKPVGRKEVPGRPLSWGTTDGFLSDFTLESLDQLPGLDDLKAAGLLDIQMDKLSLTEGLEDGQIDPVHANENSDTEQETFLT